MKKRLILLVCGVLLVSVTLQSGNWKQWLVAAGERAAWSALSRSPLPRPSLPAAAQGYEETLLSAPTLSPTSTDRVTVPVVNLSINSGKYQVTQNVSIKNGTKKSVDVATLLQGYTKPSLATDAPTVLIYHTHTTESYSDAGSQYSSDGDKGVLGVGEAMKAVFEAHGLKTLHLTDNFAVGGAFNKAYTRSLAGVEAVLKKYPSIQIVLDVHRDSIMEGDTEYCPLTTLQGKEYAQVMVISGTDTLGLSHPHWRQNLQFGLTLVKQMQQDYPGLSRPLNLNANRYNTHLTPYTLLLEVGGGANTSAQAKNSGRAVAESICKIVN